MKKAFLSGGPKPLIKAESGSLVQQEQVKQLIQIIPELEALIPALAAEEFSQLETNILREGCREPLQIWHTVQHTLDESGDETPRYVLVDGHNRYRICKTHGIEFKILLREFTDREAVRGFMIDNQLGRRNLTPEQIAYFRGLKYQSLKKSSGRPVYSNQEETGNVPIEPVSAQPAATQRTEDKLAAQYGVSPKTIRLDAAYAKGIDKLSEPLKREVLTRQTKIAKKDLIRLGESEQAPTGIETIGQVEDAIQKNPPSTLLGHTPIDSKATESQPASQSAPAPQAENQSQTQQIATIISLAKALENPTVDIQITCEQLLKRIAELVRYAQ